jgi:hypothetical protein
MATASSRSVRRASSTWRSHDLPTMHTADVLAFTRCSRVSSESAFERGRRVDPKATSVAVCSFSSAGARWKNSSSLGLAPGHPPSM